MSDMKPVAWHVRDMRGRSGPWHQCSEQSHEEYQKHSTVQTRELYTSEQLAEAVAAEQRRKAEDEVSAIYQLDIAGWCDVSKEDFFTSEADDSKKRILYTHPANVAALEARVKEMGEALCRIADSEAFCGSQTLRHTARAALTREGGV